MIAIVDYRAGNLTSVKLAFDALGVQTCITSDPAVVRSAERVVFPGVGAAASAMDSLRRLGLVDSVRAAASSEKPFLGICLGMQILFEHSEEDGGVDLLGILPGKVRRFPSVPGVKVPEIGWNSVSSDAASGLFETGAEFYFVHSYYAEITPFTVGRASYAGIEFTAAVKKDRLLATQFHPEKSGRVGMAFLKRFLAC